MKRKPPFRRGDRVVYRVTSSPGVVVDVRKAQTAFTGWRVEAELDHGRRASADAILYRPLTRSGPSNSGSRTRFESR